MLVVDGCFIIEYLAKRVFKQTPGTAHLANVRWGFAHLRRDLMLLENQIPFEGSRENPLTLMDLALAFLGVKMVEASRPPVEDVLHLLHLHHHCLNPEQLPRRSTDQASSSPFY
ncbi:hypothetical protein Taro_048451 [Colocasia esculenta]|uniref:Uncharacterized protein n=1 Tax=Colocasia esculenta TaxID=4460 RepID=A0A843X7H0_COLES|nr:hypothetical protein [Colocasia esculenta]